METNYLEIMEMHTWQAHKNTVFIGCKVYDVALDSFVDVTLKIPAHLYLEDIAGQLRFIALDAYREYLDTL